MVFLFAHSAKSHVFITDNVFVNPRHPESLTFYHLPTRTQALFYSPSRSFSRLWSTFSSGIRDSAVTNPSLHFLCALKLSFFIITIRRVLYSIITVNAAIAKGVSKDGLCFNTCNYGDPVIATDLDMAYHRF